MTCSSTTGPCEGERVNSQSKARCPWTVSNDGAQTCVACKALDSLNAQVDQTTSQLTNLLKRRQEALTALNMVHSPILRLMPVEITSSIFDFAYANGCSPLKFGAICRTWRQIAWSNPRLWTKLDVNIDRPISKRKLRIARQWLDRSGGLPLSISFCEKELLQREIEDYHRLLPLIQLVNKYSARWDALALRVPLPLMQFFSDRGGAYSSLRTLLLARSS